MSSTRKRCLALLSLLVLAIAATGARCGPAILKSVSPTDGAVVSTPSFDVTVTLGAAGDPNSLDVTLNGQDITASFSGGPTVFTATLSPGPPLLDDNTLRVRVSHTSQPTKANRVQEFEYAPPKARASLVTDAADCVTGPLAHCTVGDFLLENDRARFVIQKANQRESHAVGSFGGNLIDAEIVENGVPQGRDYFYEVQPAVNIETVINATSAEIVNDGQDGTAAIVRTCGPDDLLDDINASTVTADAGGLFPPGVDDTDYDVEGCTEYKLVAGDRYVELVTTIESMEPNSLLLYPGDYINGGGPLEQWSPLSDAAAIQMGQAGIGELFATWGVDTMSYFGFDQASGVDYALVFPRPPSGTAVTPCQGIDEPPCPSSSFTSAGVSYAMYSNAIPLVLAFGFGTNFEVPAGGSRSFTRWFSVGDGSPANATATFAEVNGLQTGTLQGCVTVSDGSATPLAGARVVTSQDVSGGTTAAEVVQTIFVTDASGCYSGSVRTGSYLVAAAKQGFAYEGGGATALMHPATVTVGATTTVDIALPQNGRLRVEAVDHTAAPLPARISVVGFDPSPEPALFASALAANDVRSALFYDDTKDPIQTGLTRTEYTDAAGIAEFDLEPGNYQVSVSRGTEYSNDAQSVTITAGVTNTVSAVIAPVLDTTGFISSDAHVHGLNSPDSRVSVSNRIHSFAGEGVDNIISTDHGAVTDALPDILAAGLGGFVHATPGEEITTFDYGHYNAYPQGLDPSQPQTNGSTDHGGASAPGTDFPLQGAFLLTPAEIAGAVAADPFNAGLETVVQINHFGGHFGPLKIDSALEPPVDGLTPLEAANIRLNPFLPNFFHDGFHALEVWNGSTISHQNEFLDGRIGVWMNLLNQGILMTAIGDTDTHTYHALRQGGARSWTPSTSDAPAGIIDVEIGRAVRAGKVVGGQGIYMQTRALATDGSGGVASLAGVTTPGAEPATVTAGTLVTVTNGEVQLEIDVQAPSWAEYDSIEIYRNASTYVAGTSGGVPTQYNSVPTTTLAAGTDFAVTPVAINGSTRLESSVTLTLSGLLQDEWIVVLVKGTQGVSKPMFPVHASGVDVATENPTLADLENVTAAESGIRALGFANALYVDVDGNGSFDPPGVSVVAAP